MSTLLTFKRSFFLSVVVLFISFHQEVNAQAVAGTDRGTIVPPLNTYSTTTHSSSGRPYWSFTAVAGRLYEFNLCTASGCSSNRVSIYSSAPSSSSPPAALRANGNGNASCNNGAVVFQAPASTTYYVGVSYGAASAHTCSSFSLRYRYLLSSYTVCASATSALPAERMISPISSCYYNSNDYYITYFPNFFGNNAVKLTFTGFSTQSGSDLLYIYNGVGIGGTQVAGSPFSGSSLPSSVTSSDNAAGALTLRFVTDGVTSSCLTGYTAAATCVSNTLLPVSLTTFNAIPEHKKVNLLWTTASEKNNDYFTVERSIDDGISFEPITKIKGSGSSVSIVNYSAEDVKPVHGVTYYRLKQTDYNNESTYSRIVAVEFMGDEVQLKDLRPNPTSENISFDFYSLVKGPLHVQIIDYTGRIVKDEIIDITEDKTTVDTSLELLSQGIYSLKAIFDKTGYSVVKKVIKH